MLTTQELIDKRKETIRRHCRGYDSSLKLSGTSSFIGILDWLDKQHITEESYISGISDTIKSKIRQTMQVASMKAARMNNQRAFAWLDNTHNYEEIYASVREYTMLNITVFSIDKETVREFSESHKGEGIYTNIIDKSHEDLFSEFIMRYGNTLYHVILPSIGSIEHKDKEIQASVCICDDSEPMAVYNYNCAVHSLDDKMNPVAETERLHVMCSNKSCASYKACIARAYEDGTKEVDCSPQLCDKCEAFKGDVVSPYKLLEAVKPIMFAYKNRTQSSRVINEGAPVHYEPLPLPESDKDIVIYADAECKNETIIRVINHDENYIPGTHASPREHERKAHYRYNKKTGLKDIKVRSCIVNKGHTKTSYTVKNHKDNIKELVVS